MDVVSYQCKNCAAPLAFDIETQKWDCKFCGSSFALEELEQDGGASQQAGHTAAHDEYTAENTVAYDCPSCGGRILTDAVTAATFCVFCHNPAIIASNLKNERAPDYILPFRLEKEAAVEAVQKLCKNKLLLPKHFRDSVHKGEVSGLYVPFWLFSCGIDVSLTASGQRVHTWQDSNYRYTKIDTYKIYRDADMALELLPADGSRKMDDRLMEAMEPFDYSGMTDFSMQYLSGHYADSYDVDAREVQDRVERRIHDGAAAVVRGTVSGYTNVREEAVNIRKTQPAVKQAMLPVWTLMHEYKGKQYVFAMNGQTGKVIGRLPMSFARLAAIFFGSFGVLFGILMLVVLFL